jgi:hypothetical protein
MHNINNLESAGKKLVDFGLQPVSNRFVLDDSHATVPSFPLQLRVNTETGLVHLGKPFPLEEVKPRYDWLTCYEPEDHLDNLVEKLIKLPNITIKSVFGAYSFKDDSTLRRLEQLGFINNWRIDPILDLGISDACANVETYQSFLTVDKAKEICERRGAVDVLIVRHVIEHAYDLHRFIDAIRCMVNPGGYIVWELPDCEQALALGDCTTIWEEHIYYFTSFTFKQLLQDSGFSITHFESVPYALENSLIAIVQESKSSTSKEMPDIKQVSKEIKRAKDFVSKLFQRKIELRNKLIKLKEENGLICMFGAGHLSVAFLSLMELSDLICCVVDDNPNKKGKQMPIGGLNILGSEALQHGDIKVCLLGLNPQNQPNVIDRHKKFVKEGGIFISIFPEKD